VLSGIVHDQRLTGDDRVLAEGVRERRLSGGGPGVGKSDAALEELPVALVSLVDRDRQFFKSCVGLPEPWATTRETPLSHSFCQHTVITGEPLVVDDAREHPELRHNLAVPDIGVVAYAGVPLVTSDGEILGAFCAIDTKPRRWSEADIETLRDLAESAASEIDLRLTIGLQRRAERARDQAERGLRLLAESGRVLSSSLDLEKTLTAVTQLAVPEMADLAIVDLIEGGAHRRVAVAGGDPTHNATVERMKSFPPRLDDGGPQAEAIRTGRSVLIATSEDTTAAAGARAESYVTVVRELGITSGITAPLAIGKEVLGALSVARTGARAPFDNADRGLAEELARRAALAVHSARLYDEARAASRARDDTLSVVSHDLRNPIHTIFMSASFLQEILPDDATVARDHARVMKRSAERANRLIGDLLDVTRIEGGQLALDRRLHVAAELAEEALDHARLAAEDKGILLSRGPLDDGIIVRADRDRVLQVLSNLISNSLKFTPRDGHVIVSLTRERDMARFSVADTGPGIAAEHLPHIFDRFWQANRTDKRGVGLGLSIVKGIAESHGGEVRVETTLGVGSIFSVLLPVAQVRESRSHAADLPVTREPSPDLRA